MIKKSNQVMAGIRKSLVQMSETIQNRPVVFIDEKGGYWLNSIAGEFISTAGIERDGFLDWLRIGSAHLQNFSLGSIEIGMIRLPEGGTIALLKHNDAKSGPEEQFLLTEKENEILRHLSRGLSNRKIAESMGIRPGTVNSHLDRIYQKLFCSSRAMACLIALKKGLLLPSCKPVQPLKRAAKAGKKTLAGRERGNRRVTG
jgi:DNA-binding CsgD family transcriptional regulator